MAGDTLPAQHLKAGEEYLAALMKLGLTPEFLAWGQETNTQNWVLVMVTPTLEVGGPLAMNELLFKAYNTHATPQEISPFIVRVYGNRTLVAPLLKQLASVDVTNMKAQKVDKRTHAPIGEPHTIEMIGQTFDDVHIKSANIYKISRRAPKGHDQRVKEWLRFKGNVERLAA